jgi:protein-disulfide isomerase
MGSDTKIIGGILVVSLIVVSLILGFGGNSPSSIVDQTPIAVEKGELVRPDAPTLGSPDAPVTIVEFADYQCPACALATPILNQLIVEQPDKVRLVFRYFPLTSIHKNAFASAQAAEAAGVQEKYWEMHDLLFAKQKEWDKVLDPKTLFTDYATSLGLNSEQFATDYVREDIVDRIRLGLGDANALGLRSTPTIFVNGQQTAGFDKETLDEAITAALAETLPAQ